MFSWFPGTDSSRQRQQVEELFEKAQKETLIEYEPIGKVGAAIIQASVNNRDETKKWIDAPTEVKRLEREAYVFFEYIYFYMHLTMRHAYSTLSTPQVQKLQEYLALLIPSVAVDSYFAHWPDDVKEKMTGEFIEKLNDAEIEYTELVRNSKSENGGDKFLEMFSLLASHISDLCGSNIALVARPLIIHQAFQEWTKMDLDTLMTEISHTE